MIKRFAQCLREYKWTALVSPVCMIGEVAMEVTIPLVMADLYDYGIAVGNMTVVCVALVFSDIACSKRMLHVSPQWV